MHILEKSGNGKVWYEDFTKSFFKQTKDEFKKNYLYLITPSSSSHVGGLINNVSKEVDFTPSESKYKQI